MRIPADRPPATVVVIVTLVPVADVPMSGSQALRELFEIAISLVSDHWIVGASYVAIAFR